MGGDDRAGIAIIIEVVENIVESGKSYRPLEILFTSGEDMRLVGSKKFDFKKIKAKEGFVLDEEGGINTIIYKSVGYVGFEGKIIGKQAHSSEPDKGIHAIKAVAELIHNMPFGKCTENTMVNVGMINGGEVVNAITESVFLKGEIRSVSSKELEKYTEIIKNEIKEIHKKFGTEDSIVFKSEFDPIEHKLDDSFLEKTKSVMKSIDLNPRVIKSMGGSDANVINQNGIKTLLLAAGYYKCHSMEEYVKIDDLFEGVNFLLAFLKN